MSAIGAVEPSLITVQLKHLLGAGSLMKPVNILRYYRRKLACTFPLGQLTVGNVGLCLTKVVRISEIGVIRLGSIVKHVTRKDLLKGKIRLFSRMSQGFGFQINKCIVAGVKRGFSV